MKLVVVGVNHKTAPVALREQLAFGDDLELALKQLGELSCGATIVSTCNRSEIYAYVHDEMDNDGKAQDNVYGHDHHALVHWLARFKKIDLSNLSPYLYVYESNRALTHWLRVAVGLDSMILGEPQILGQIKQAVAKAHENHAISPAFDWLTQKIFGAARIVRRDTALGKQAVTLGFATAKLVTQIFDNPTKTTLLIVAAGEMNRLVAHNVAALGMQRIIICNRSHERAKTLGDELTQMAQTQGRAVDVEMVGLDKLSDVLPQADVVSSCSGSMQVLIDKSMVKTAMKLRKNRAMLMVDLAVPRDIEPSVGELDGVYLYSIDDLQHVIEGNINERKQAAVEAELLVGQLVATIEADMQSQLIGKTIADYRNIAHSKKDELLAKAKHALQAGDNPEKVLETFAYQLTQSLIHPPSRLLRQSVNYLDEQTLAKLSDDIIHAYRHKS